jgi:Cu(I)/Ag(I) efflux system membrane fusion protein
MITKYGKAVLISILLLSLVILITIVIIAMQTNSGSEKGTAGQIQAKQYVCSMHPEVIQETPGDCPICGMSLIEKVNQSALPQRKQYVCSMHPEVIENKPGDCPICGMSLIEKIGRDTNSSDTLLTDVVRSVNESVLASVATVSPVQANLPLIIEASGIINYDTRRVSTVSARFGGLIERSFVKYQFQPIRKGQKIYEIYCPDIYTEKWNYVKVLQAYPDQDNLTVEAREWLKLLGLTAGQIDSLKRAPKPNYHLTVYSDADGYAVSADFDPENYFSFESGEQPPSEAIGAGRNIGFNDGLTVETGDQLFKILNTRSLRADLKVRTDDVGLLKKGQKIILEDATFPDRKFEATISQIEPLNGGLFQLVKAFFTDNKGFAVPGSQIHAHILAGDRNALWLSKTAIVNLGERQSVFVMTDNKFIATTVKTGLRSGDKIEIISGIDPDSKIALNAFLLTDFDGFINPDPQ